MDKRSSITCRSLLPGLVVALLIALLLGLIGCAPESAPTVTLIADGETRTLTTEAPTVRELLAEAGITLDEDDRVKPVEPTFIRPGMSVRVIRVETRVKTEEQEIPYERRTVRDVSIPVGETRILEAGVTGVEELTYRITLEDGTQINRQLVNRTTVREPHDEVVLIGAQPELDPVPITGTVAYVANRNAWVIQTTSPNRRRLTYSGDLDGRVFSLSPDGTHLLYTRVTTSTGQGRPLNTLWMIDTTTVDAEPVRLDAESILWADWAPDCQTPPSGWNCDIAYTTGTWAEGDPGWKAENDLWVARPRTSDGRLIGQRLIVEPGAGGTYGWWGTTYAWAPDAVSLAYARPTEVGTVLVGNGRRLILAEFPPYRTYQPWAWAPTVSWSPEGDFIVTTLHGPSPTGEAAEESPVFDVWTLRATGTISAELVNETGMWAAPVYAPAGGLIVYGHARSPYASQTSSYELHLMDRDGSDRRLLFPPQEEMGLSYPSLAWAPGGERLAVIYQENLYLLDLADDVPHPLTTEGGVSAVEWR